MVLISAMNGATPEFNSDGTTVKSQTNDPKNIKIFSDKNGNNVVDKSDFDDPKFAEYLEQKGLIGTAFDKFKDVAKGLYEAFISETSMPKVGAGWGEEDSHYDYIYKQLEAKGISLGKLNVDALADVIARFDYDLDPDMDGILNVDDVNSFGSTRSLNKDENGNPVNTHALDYIVNMYMLKQEQTNNPQIQEGVSDESNTDEEYQNVMKYLDFSKTLPDNEAEILSQIATGAFLTATNKEDILKAAEELVDKYKDNQGVVYIKSKIDVYRNLQE